MLDTISNYWLDLAAEEIRKRFPEGKIVISSGISPSANYHVGHFREILTTEALAWAVRQRGREVDHVHVVDNFDPLRKRYEFLPERFEVYVGMPICMVPSPDETEDISYADHFFNEFKTQAVAMGVMPTKIIKSYEDLYKPGRMVQAIEDSLEQVEAIKLIFATKSNRRLEADWSPVQVLNDANHFEQGRVETWDKANQTINGFSYLNGRAKLNWRLDWPARWRELGVQVEPFSHQEHGAAGSSYDTGKEFSRQVFHYQPPYPGAEYGNIHMLGDTKKMSSSKGNLVTPRQALDIMPPEILRYFVVRSRPDKTIYFDPGLGFYNLVNEYKDIMKAVQSGERHEFQDAYKFASDISGETGLSTAPFQQLVMVYQTALGDFKRILELLAKLGWQPADGAEEKALQQELTYVHNWLEHYAPESAVFKLQDKLNKSLQIDAPGQAYLDALVVIFGTAVWEGDSLQSAIFEAAKAQDYAPSRAFGVLYQLFIAQDRGPKLGPFLATLERDFVMARLRREQ